MSDETVDFKPYFAKYEALVDKVEGVFKRVKQEHGDQVKCKTGCSDCCWALFDLTLIEAVYISTKFRELFKDADRQEMRERANRADRKIYKIKRDANKFVQLGKNEVEILAKIGAERVRCPMLSLKDTCDMYAYRPITCRLYGIPTSINGMSHTCGMSGFEEGVPYPTVNMDAIYKQLYEISAEFVASIDTKYPKMADMLVPLSMAMLTEYNAEYLGIKGLEKREKDSSEEK